MTFSDGIPSWIVAGLVAAGGWAMEQESQRTDALHARQLADAQRLARLESFVELQADINTEIKDSLHRIENWIMEDAREQGH